MRFFTAEGDLVLKPEEVITQKEEQLEQEAQKSQRLADKLRELNIDPEAI